MVGVQARLAVVGAGASETHVAVAFDGDPVVYLVQPLSFRVPGLELVIAERPGRGDAVGVPQLAEVLRPQPAQRGAV
jgi:hypothetical protein